MKVQWKLVDIETGKAIPVDEEFELIDFMKQFFDREEPMRWDEACILFGDPVAIKNPTGILEWTSKKLTEER